MYTKSNTIIHDPKQILKEEENFYKKLYTRPASETIDTDLLKNDNIPKLSEEESKCCDKPITLLELGKALKDLPNKKTPGTDGLTTFG